MLGLGGQPLVTSAPVRDRLLQRKRQQCRHERDDRAEKRQRARPTRLIKESEGTRDQRRRGTGKRTRRHGPDPSN